MVLASPKLSMDQGSFISPFFSSRPLSFLLLNSIFHPFYPPPIKVHRFQRFYKRLYSSTFLFFSLHSHFSKLKMASAGRIPLLQLKSDLEKTINARGKAYYKKKAVIVHYSEDETSSALDSDIEGLSYRRIWD